jgi:hypothetical protein
LSPKSGNPSDQSYWSAVYLIPDTSYIQKMLIGDLLCDRLAIFFGDGNYPINGNRYFLYIYTIQLFLTYLKLASCRMFDKSAIRRRLLQRNLVISPWIRQRIRSYVCELSRWKKHNLLIQSYSKNHRHFIKQRRISRINYNHQWFRFLSNFREQPS